MSHPPQIPLTPQTDERNFPRWNPNAPRGQSGHPFPRMLTKICSQADRDEWVTKNGRKDHGEVWYDQAGPVIGAPIPIVSTPALVTEGLCQLANEPIIVNNSDEERRILEALGLAIPEPPVHPQSIVVEVPAATAPRSESTPKKKQHRKKASAKAEPAADSEPVRGHLKVDRVTRHGER